MTNESIGRKDGQDAGLSDEAIEWLVLLHSGRATPADRCAFAAWESRSAAHAAAARAASELWRGVGETRIAHAYSQRVARPGLSPAAGRISATTRRAVLGGAIAASAAAAVAGVTVLGPVSGLLADYATRVGEQRQVRLPDGSLAVLNTASALSVDFTDRQRRLELHAGEAMFEVAKDAARPFAVTAANGEARALGTIFSVRRDGVVRVQVSEGDVEVRIAGAGEAAIRLTGGQRVTFGAGEAPTAPEAFDVAAETAWRRGKLIFNRRPLGEVASELERYRTGRIVIADPKLRRLEVTGVFDLKDTGAVMQAIERTLPVTLVQLPHVTVIY